MMPTKIDKASLGLLVLAMSLEWITVIHAQSPQIRIRSSFDHPCNKTLKCKSQSWLTCDNETQKCKCAKPEEMIYDQTRGICVASVGERCKFGFDEESESAAWYERTECVEGSVCSPLGVCICPDGFYDDSENDKCSRFKDNEQSCLNENECNKEKFLICIEGKCRCDPDTSVYTVNSFLKNYDYDSYKTGYGRERVPPGMCVGRVGAQCSRQGVTPGRYCVENAYCKSDSSGSSICRCMSTYGETYEKLCGPGYQQSCNDTSICSGNLRCSGHENPNSNTIFRQQLKCQCSDPDFQIHDWNTATCRGLVGAPCDPNEKSSCIDKSSCIERDNVFYCECNDGFIDTDSGHCQIAFGSSCNYMNNNDVDIAEICDQAASLRCKLGICSCKNKGQFYENKKRKCLTTVGLKCKVTSDCVSNSECVKSDGSLWGRCICPNGFSMTKEHTCEKPNESDVSSEFAVFEDNDGRNSTISV